MKLGLVAIALTSVVALTGCSAGGSAAEPEPALATSEAAVPSEAAVDFASVAVSPECDAAMQTAAAVPLGQIAVNELITAGAACPSMDEFASAVYLYPNAIGMTSFTDEDVLNLIIANCFATQRAGQVMPVCTEPDAKGYMTD